MGPYVPRDARSTGREALRVSVLVLPDATIGSVTGMLDVLSCFPLLSTFDDSVPGSPPFEVELVAESSGDVPTAGGLTLPVHRSVADPGRTDIAIVPSLLVPGAVWEQGRYPELVGWLERLHGEGALLCSACSGVLLIAETGLLSGREATVHPAYAATFRSNFPDVGLRLEETLVAAGEREEFVMAGASASWHDLVLYLVARHVGPTAAQAVQKFMLLQWHLDGQGPYVPFAPRTDHGDAIVEEAQEWLRTGYAVAAPVTELVERSGLPERTFKRRFARATGLAPIAYVQHVRVEEAKRRLERTSEPVDAISYAVGYEDPASFRRLFKRITGVTAGAYRRKLQLPAFARTPQRQRAGRGTRAPHVQAIPRPSRGA
jgi:transcriptional regulator GlxA family with amidase domain